MIYNPKKQIVPNGIPSWSYQELSTILTCGLCNKSQIYTSDFEKVIKEYFNVKFCFFTELGRQALTLCLKAIQIDRDSEVILPSFVCQNVLAPVLSVGAVPIYSDIDHDFNMLPKSVEGLITERTGAIIVPHIYGKTAKILHIQELAKKKGIPVIDDAAQAIGAKIEGQPVGSFGDAGILSFGPFKSISATRGGAVVSNNPKIIESLKKIQLDLPDCHAFSRGIKSIIKFKFRKLSWPYLNNRSQQNISSKKIHKPYEKHLSLLMLECTPQAIDDLDLKIVAQQIRKLPEIIKKRKRVASCLTSLLIKHKWLEVRHQFSSDNVFVTYTINVKKLIMQCSKRSSRCSIGEMIHYLRKRGIEAYKPYDLLHKKNFMDKSSCSLRNTEIIEYVICLPIYADMNPKDIKYLADNIESLPALFETEKDLS